MSEAVLSAHSLAEAYLYLMVTPCPACGTGALSSAQEQAEVVPSAGDEARTGSARVELAGRCTACGQRSAFTFLLSGPVLAASAEPALVNPTNEPSQIIDLAQWLTLFRAIGEAAQRESNKVQARHLGLEAAQCLEEALKFYTDPNNDLPPSDAVWHERSQQRLREHPNQFSRDRLRALRAKLPSRTAMERSLHRPPRPWWRRWWPGRRS